MYLTLCEVGKFNVYTCLSDILFGMVPTQSSSQTTPSQQDEQQHTHNTKLIILILQSHDLFMIDAVYFAA